MNRRNLVKTALHVPLLLGGLSEKLAFAKPKSHLARRDGSRVRPGDAGWPQPKEWEELRRAVGGRLAKPRSPFEACRSKSSRCSEAQREINNPFYLGDEVALTQSSGWANAWTSQPSAYAVAAINTSDVVAAVNFARIHNLRLVVKGGGHSYQGTSQAPDSLLIWTRHMNAIELHEAFVGNGCEGRQAPQPAVTLGAGAMWMDAYDAVTTRGGRYVQGGGCNTVGVAGLIQSGGFGSYSKSYGCAAAGLIEAEVVTADGQVRIANANQHEDLFWGLKGGGGGSLGVLTRLTLKTRELPDSFGAVGATIKAASGDAYQALIGQMIRFYKNALFNRHWGEQISFGKDTLKIDMVSHGLHEQQVESIWAPFFEWVRGSASYSFTSDAQVLSVPARSYWDSDFLKGFAPAAILVDTRPEASDHRFWWSGDQGDVGGFLYGYQSAWLPAELLADNRQQDLVEALFASSQQHKITLHFNKGLAGAPSEEITAAKDTAMNPAVLEAFALVICGSGGPPAYAGLPGEGPNLLVAADRSAKIDLAMQALARVAPESGAYVSESNFFQPRWQKAFWGENYARLQAVKKRFDPNGLFYMWHGVGSEGWSEDGFTRL